MDGSWAAHEPCALRFVADLVAAELGRARRSAAGLPARPWTGRTTLAELGVDSLEAVELAAALSQAIHLHRAGIEDALLARRTLGGWAEVVQAGLQAFHAEMTFTTSGSTGMPQACTHELAALEEEVAELARLFKPRERIVTTVPSHHIYGFLFTILLPQRLGLDGDAVVDMRAHSPASVAASLRPGDLLVGYPDLWRGVARAGAAIVPGVAGVTSTGPCDDATAAAVEASGIDALFHVYGSSQSGGVAFKRSHGDAFRLFGFWKRVAGDDSALMRCLPSGRAARVPLQDHVRWLDAETFELGARVDAAVQVGGVNVFPERVRDVILRYPGVRDAAVRLMNPDEGSRLKAFVAVEPGAEVAVLETRLREWLEGRLSVPERPRAIRFGHVLPRSESGKLADWALESAELRSPAQG